MKPALSVLLLVAALLGSISQGNSDQSRHLVLVTSASSGVHSLTSGETRRLFLGFPVIKDGHSLEAAVNRSDPFLYQVFLQKVVYMSSSVYERHLLANAVQSGGQRPQIYHDTRTLVRALDESPGTVALLWKDDVRADHNLIILDEVWEGTAQ